MYSKFIGKSLIEVEEILKRKGIDYIIKKTAGGKDEEILNEEYVICVREKTPLELIISKFKTSL